MPSHSIGSISKRAAAVAALIALAGAAGCSKEEGAGAGGGSAGGAAAADPREALLAAWKKGGLEPSAMAAATVAFGKDCKSGTVKNVDVLLCVYPSPAEAKAAADAAYDWVGSATGSSAAVGALLVAIADRRKADPSGKMINQLMKLAPQ